MPETSTNISDNGINALMEFSTRLNDTEEKQRLLKDRLLLIGDNLVSTKEDYEHEFIEIKKNLKQLEYDLKVLKQLTQRIVNEIGNFSKKSDLEMLERQFKMFEPLGFVRQKDVQELIKLELNKINKNGEKNVRA